MLNAETVGAAIRQVREKKGISQEVVSSFAGIGRTHLSAIERGQRKPTLETFFRLSEALGMAASDLMRERKFKRKMTSRRKNNKRRIGNRGLALFRKRGG